LLADFNDVLPQNGVKHLEAMGSVADNLIQTKWFRRRATDNDRMRIQHVKEQIDMLNAQLVSNSIGMKQCMFYLMFTGSTRKELNAKLASFKEEMYTFNTG
jgi:hypothetical protein